MKSATKNERLLKTWLPWLLILTLALGLRIAAAVVWQNRVPAGQKFALPDSEGYWTLARQIARGEDYRYGLERDPTFRTPGYPLLLAGWMSAAGTDWDAVTDKDVMTARMLSAVLGTLAVGGVAWVAWMLLGRRAAIIAGLLAACYPGAIAMSVVVLSEAPFVPLVVLQLGLWILLMRAETASLARRAILSLLIGLVAGLATLMRPSWLLFTPLAMISLMLGSLFSKQEDKQFLGKHILHGEIMLLALALVMFPWWFRNFGATGQSVVTTLQFGASLYDGQNPNASGASDMSYVPRFVAEAEALSTEKRHRAAIAIYCNETMKLTAINWMQENPGRVIELAGIKFARIWNIWPNEAAFRSWPIRLGVAATYLPAMILAALGAWRLRRQWPIVLLLVLPAIYITLLHVVFVGSIRYREPVMLPLLVLAAGTLATMLPGRKPFFLPSPLVGEGPGVRGLSAGNVANKSDQIK